MTKEEEGKIVVKVLRILAQTIEETDFTSVETISDAMIRLESRIYDRISEIVLDPDNG